MYDSYQACIALAGATSRPVTLRPPDYGVRSGRAARGDHAEDEAAADQHTAQPDGQGARRATSCSSIADLAIEHDLIVVTDEVYEHLTFDGVEHISLATLPGMRERTLVHLERRQDVQHHRLEDRLDLRSARAGRRGEDREAVPHLRQRRTVPGRHRRRARARRRRSSPSSPPTCRPSATGCCRASSRPASRCTRRAARTSSRSTSGRCVPTATAWRSAASSPPRCGVVAIPNEVFYANKTRGAASRAVRVQQAARRARRGGRAARRASPPRRHEARP